MFIEIFGRRGCPFCVFAKALAEKLESAGAIEGHRYVDMRAEGISKADLTKSIGKPVTTVPQIFIDQTHVGGFSEFERYVREQALLSPATTK